MQDLWPAYLTAIVLGAAHALEVDHMVAVNAFLGNRPRLAAAASFGMRWGLGHSLVVMVAGGLLVATGIAVPAALVIWAELMVGAALVGLGIWAWRTSGSLHLHTPREHEGHAHLHSHPLDEHPHRHEHVDCTRRHRHLSTLVGAVHGLAGTATVTALIPVTLISGFWGPLGYLAAFGVGTIAAMGGYATLAAMAVTQARSLAIARAVGWVTAGGSVLVGLFWIVNATVALIR